MTAKTTETIEIVGRAVGLCFVFAAALALGGLAFALVGYGLELVHGVLCR